MLSRALLGLIAARGALNSAVSACLPSPLSLTAGMLGLSTDAWTDDGRAGERMVSEVDGQSYMDIENAHLANC